MSVCEGEEVETGVSLVGSDAFDLDIIINMVDNGVFDRVSGL